MTIWKVAVKAPLDTLLSYSSSLPLVPGQSVKVPLGKRFAEGVVIEPDLQPSTAYQLKDISEINEDRPVLAFQHLQWGQWLAKYYHYPPGEVFSLFFPPLTKKGRSEPKDIFLQQIVEKQLALTQEQQNIVDVIGSEKKFSPHLLWGITGSGKTEVYIDLIKKNLIDDLGALILVPEIALTPQLVSRFRNRLGDQIAVLHSDLTEREKTNQWWSVVDGQKKVLIGARSALFCPMPKLGLIVIDEEHEGSYKQDESLRYNARDAAVMLAHYQKIPVLLGSATPSLESWKNMLDKKYMLHVLKNRPTSMLLPDIEVIDMAELKDDSARDANLPFWLSKELYQALAENYKNGFQSALFLNRRGIAQTVLCNSCGFIYKCPNCEISLTLHGKSHLVCHYCQYAEEMSRHCPSCKTGEIKPIGMGTEQIQEDVQKLFPMANVFRVDRDEIDSRQRMQDFVDKMESGEIHFLVGTQMIAKGLDFEKLTLVGIVLADVGFHIPDFRASERSYQLLTQVSGRAGRHNKGKVIVQTYRPDHPSVTYAKNYDTQGFLQFELEQREELRYPPFQKLACIKLSGLHLQKVEDGAQQIASALKGFVQKKSFSNVQILGPAHAPLLKIRNRFRYQILLKSQSVQDLHHLLQYAQHIEGQLKQIKVQIDMDPYNLM